jgi:hypothetical protein
MPTSPEPKKPETIEDKIEADEKENEIKEDVDNDYDQFSSSSSSDEQEDAAGGGGDNDDDKDDKGIVEQIFNQDKET